MVRLFDNGLGDRVEGGVTQRLTIAFEVRDHPTDRAVVSIRSGGGFGAIGRLIAAVLGIAVHPLGRMVGDQRHKILIGAIEQSQLLSRSQGGEVFAKHRFGSVAQRCDAGGVLLLESLHVAVGIADPGQDVYSP